MTGQGIWPFACHIPLNGRHNGASTRLGRKPAMNLRKERVTVNDVAAAAGVSKSTVSRILDDRLPKSHSETAQKVREVAARLGYVKDLSAASLRRGSTHTIGVVVPRLTDTVMALLYEALAQEGAKRGRTVLVATTQDEPQAVRKAAESLLQKGVDGLVLSTAKSNDHYPEELRARGVSFVLALRTDGKHPSAVGDDELGGYLATRHLLDLGHTEIGLIAGPAYASSSAGRQAGYRRAMLEAGLGIDDSLIVPSSFSIDSGAEAAELLMQRPGKITAIFAINDNCAIGAMSTLTRMGVAIPESISVVGYNDIPIVSRLPVPLTTVRVPFEQIATAALDMLEHPDADAPLIRSFAPTLIPRKSSAKCMQSTG